MRLLFIFILFISPLLQAQNYHYALNKPKEVPATNHPSTQTFTEGYLEAELGDNSGSRWEFAQDQKASGGFYAVAPTYPYTDFDNWNTKTSNTKERLNFTIENVEAGTYTVWIKGEVRGRGKGCWVSVNNSDKAYEFYDPSDKPGYHWVSNHGNNGLKSKDKKIRFDLKDGKNTITIIRKQSNFRIDKLFLSKNDNLPEKENRVIKTIISSAGVYDNKGRLIRTLWNNQPKTQTVLNKEPNWDGLRDNGKKAPKGNYDIKITTNNIKYEWEGVVGNTTNDFSGTKFNIGSYARMLDMTIEGKFGYITLGYNEGENKPSSLKIDLSNPYQRVELDALNPFNRGQESYCVVSDGETVYWGGLDSYSTNQSQWFVFGTKVKDDSFRIFPAGSSYTPPSGSKAFPSIIARVKNKNATITGMAVQRTGDHLYVAHKDLNEIKVYDKKTGTLVHNLSDFKNPFRLFIDKNGKGDLWIAHEQGVEKFKIANDGQLKKTGIIIPNENALGLSGTYDGETVSIIDGKDQQIKTYQTNNGQLVKTFGQPGGYENSPEVYDDKFYFGDEQNEFQPHRGITFAAYEADGSIWINDTWNHRVQHFKGNTLKHSIYTQDPLKQVAINPNEPKRLFYYYHEFEIDYSKPFDNFNGSWKLKRNWRAQIQSHKRDGMAAGFQNVATLSNGKTYAQMLSPSNSRARYYEIVELNPKTGLRYTGITQGRFGEMLHYDGSLRPRGAYNHKTNSVEWYKRDVKSFDGSGNPVWGPKKTLASIQKLTKDDPYNFGASMIPAPLPQVTPNDIIVTYNSDLPSNGGTNYHLGGVKLGTSEYLWKTSKNTPSGYSGNYPTDGRFDIGNGVNHNAGGIAVTIENHVFWNYRGEFWKQRQTNYWQHFNANSGAMLGRFGTHAKKTPVKGQAGNVFSGGIVKVNGNYYLYHNGEAHHYGVHRWKISNINSIKETSFPVSIK